MSTPMDLTGSRFGRLLVIGLAPRLHGRIAWMCVCDCGTYRTVCAKTLRNGMTQSCGCLKIERTIEARTKHNMCSTPTYCSWQGMITRCTNPNQKSFKNYGGRGITISPELRTFEGFYKVLGERPQGLTLERRDTNKGYTVENTYWANKKTQANNTRANRMLTFNGKTQSLAQWSEELGIPYCRIKRRLQLGWSIERSFTSPICDTHGRII